MWTGLCRGAPLAPAAGCATPPSRARAAGTTARQLARRRRWRVSCCGAPRAGARARTYPRVRWRRCVARRTRRTPQHAPYARRRTLRSTSGPSTGRTPTPAPPPRPPPLGSPSAAPAVVSRAPCSTRTPRRARAQPICRPRVRAPPPLRCRRSRRLRRPRLPRRRAPRRNCPSVSSSGPSRALCSSPWSGGCTSVAWAEGPPSRR
mmetsp:Transcript_28001/g.68895  ORF Transcript_28001/g.68895 Transcript_28001/m.68895 type:complete len:205 (-) Transcript_28001:303-917(-)